MSQSFSAPFNPSFAEKPSPFSSFLKKLSFNSAIFCFPIILLLSFFSFLKKPSFNSSSLSINQTSSPKTTKNLPSFKNAYSQKAIADLHKMPNPWNSALQIGLTKYGIKLTKTQLEKLYDSSPKKAQEVIDRLIKLGIPPEYFGTAYKNQYNKRLNYEKNILDQTQREENKKIISGTTSTVKGLLDGLFSGIGNWGQNLSKTESKDPYAETHLGMYETAYSIGQIVNKGLITVGITLAVGSVINLGKVGLASGMSNVLFEMIIKNTKFTIARIIAIVMLLFAIQRHAYGYYQILRIIVCIVSVYGAYKAAKSNEESWAWTLGSIAVVFNPIVPVRLKSIEMWHAIDLITAGIIFASIPLLNNEKK